MSCGREPPEGESLNGESVDEYVRVAEFRSALRRFLRRTERVARISGLTPQRYQLRLMIKGAPGGRERSTVTELAERLQLAQSTVTELVDRAVDAGLLQRERSRDDGRVVDVRLTPEGEARLSSAFTTLESERRDLVTALVNLEGS
jgi:DNA-binding MarR family transcriptional regulator